MDVTDEEMIRQLDHWHQTVVKWQQSRPSVQLLHHQQELTQQLVYFLDTLKRKLDILSSVQEAVGRFPVVGQVLGRLITCPVLLCDPVIYQSLMSCILWFYMDNPLNPIEAKAKSWAVSQVRSTVCHAKKQLRSRVLDTTGTSQETFNNMCLDELLQERWTEVRPLHRKLDSKIEEELLNHSECTLLTGACSVCLQLTHIERLDDLLGKFLGAVTRVNIEEGHREDVQRLYTLICNTQTQAYIDADCQVKLSYSTQLAVWKAHLPSLEQEVLSLVRACTNHGVTMSVSKTQSLIKSRHLVRACSEDSQVYQAVFGMLYLLWQQTEGGTNITRVLSALHGSVRLYCMNSSPETTHCLSSLYPRGIQALVSLMEIPPTVLDQVACEHQLEVLSRHLSMIYKGTGCGDRQPSRSGDTGLIPQYVLLQYHEVYSVALMLALMGTKQVLNACCDVLLVFSDGSVQDSKKEMLETVLAFRSFMSRSDIHWYDIHHVLCTNQCSDNNGLDEKNPISSLIGQLLMVFITHSVSGATLAQEVMKKVFGYEDALSQLLGLQETVAIMSVFWTSPLGLAPLRPITLVDLLNLLTQQAKQDVSASHDADSGQDRSPTGDCSPCDVSSSSPGQSKSGRMERNRRAFSDSEILTHGVQELEEIKRLLMGSMSS